jgi:hypothetical protein
MDSNRMRNALLRTWAARIETSANKKLLTGTPCPIRECRMICGPRAGALELDADLYAGKLLRALSRSECAALRHLIPDEWEFTGEPQAFMRGRWLRVEVGWPDELADSMIRLGQINKRPVGDGRWALGLDELGRTVVGWLSDKTPHILVAGTSGSGKSVTVQGMALQFSIAGDVDMVLCDGKGGESLRKVARLPGVLGPCAVEGPEVRGALGWACAEMTRRYNSGTNGHKRLAVFVDEFQTFNEDEVIVSLLSRLTAQGRAANVHAILATQNPRTDSYGDPTIPRNIVGRIALCVTDYAASNVAVGGNIPRADKLQMQGDSYYLRPGACYRTQIAYVDEQEITAGMGDSPDWRFTRWPDYEPLDIGQDAPEDNCQFRFRGDELAVALVSATLEEGRTLFERRMEKAGFGKPGYKRQKVLRGLGKTEYDWLDQNNYAVCKKSESAEDPRNVRIVPDVWG